MDLLEPALDVGKRPFLIYRIGEDDDECSLIESIGQVFEFFLASSVPDLQLYFVLLNLHCFYFEVNANGGGVCRFESVIAVAEQDVCFANPAISYYHCLDHVITVLLSLGLHLTF